MQLKPNLQRSQMTVVNKEIEREIDKPGYWCVICMRYIEPDPWGVIIHDDVPHPIIMDLFNEEANPQ